VRLYNRNRHWAFNAFLVALLATVLGVGMVDATSGHYRSGSGQEFPGEPDHNNNNPGHHWLRIGKTNGGTISSGGRYHDGCAWSTSLGRYWWCRGANGGDYALDFAATGSTALAVDWAGWAAGASKSPANWSNLSIYAQVSASGNYHLGHAACQWQKYDLWLEWYDSSGGYNFNKLGWLVLAHQYQWQHTGASGWILPNAVRTRDDINANPGTTVSYLNYTAEATVYPSADYNESWEVGEHRCSFGAHTHLETFSFHNWGAMYETHGKGPDYYYDNHVECTPPPNDDCSTGPVDPGAGYPGPYSPYTWVALIGGNTRYDAMW